MFDPARIFGDNNPWQFMLPLPDSFTAEGLLRFLFINGLSVLLLVAFILWVITAVRIGLAYMQSAGDEKKLAEAGAGFKNLFIGLTLAIVVIFVVHLIASATLKQGFV